ncbi:MAG: YdeI/OmpD-associated family protein [Candidatus Pacearchaeota archaeon]
MTIPRINIFSAADFRKWLDKNHLKEKIVELLIHKRHTGKYFPSHRELLEEAICYGWIDTIIRRIDDDRFIRTFQKRTEKSSWSLNTLGYARNLIKEKRMTKHGFKFYYEGRKKKALDHGIPRNPRIPIYLIKKLKKDEIAKENFNSLTPSTRRTYLRWLLMAKTENTREKRVQRIIKRMNEKDWRVLRF